MTSPIDEAAMLACPFCGGTASQSIGKNSDGSDWHYIECDTLGCGAIAAPAIWNTRTAAKPAPDDRAWNEAIEAATCTVVMDTMSAAADKDARFLLRQLNGPEPEAKQLAQIKNFRNQIICAAVGYALAKPRVSEQDGGGV